MSTPVADDFGDIAVRLKFIQQEKAERLAATPLERPTEVKAVVDTIWARALIHSTPTS